MNQRTLVIWTPLQEFLRSVGISVDSSGAVIKQAQVTRLADLNSPAELAAVVADASGLGKCIGIRRDLSQLAVLLADGAQGTGPANKPSPPEV